MSLQELVSEMRKYKFYHIISLPEGLVTPGNPRLVPQQDLVMRNLAALQLDGRRVLDVGCRDGLFSFAAERHGASEVIGIDNDLSPGATEFLIPHLKSKVKMYEMNVLDLSPSTFGMFDVVICAGLLYHLRYPFHALRIIRSVLHTGATLLIETALLRAWERHPLLYCPTSDESPYDATSVTFFNCRGLHATLSSLGFEVVSTDFLYGRKLRSTPGVTTRHRLLAGAIRVQQCVPGLVHAMLGRFVIDRAVVVCRRAATLSGAAYVDRYWHATHAKHSAGQDRGMA